MYGDFSRLLDLATIQGGQLNEDFLEHYKDVLSSLKKGESGKITINKPKADDERPLVVLTCPNSW